MATESDEVESKKIVLQSLKYELVKISELKPHPDNPNKHSRAQIEEIKRQIVHQGVRHGLIKSSLSGYIVVGCGRLEAFKELGFKKAPVATQDFNDEAHEYSFMVADNALQRQSKLDLSDIQARVLDLGPEIDLSLLAIPNFTIGEPPALDVAVPTVSGGKQVECPECHHKFEIV